MILAFIIGFYAGFSLAAGLVLLSRGEDGDHNDGQEW